MTINHFYYFLEINALKKLSQLQMTAKQLKI